MKIMVTFLGNKKKNTQIKNIGKRKVDELNFRNKTCANSKYINNLSKNSICAKVINNSNKDIKGNTNIYKTHNVVDKKIISNNLKKQVSYKTNEKIKLKKSKLYKKNEFNNLNLVNTMKVMILSIAILLILFNNGSIPNDIISKLSTNFRQADKFSFHTANLVKSYGIYNVDNYIINEPKQEEVKIAEKIVVNSDEEILDKEAEVVDVASLWGDKNINVEITENSSSIQRVTIGNTKILNYSSKRDINYEEILNSDAILTKKSDKILLYNTHTSESYANSEKYKFDYTGTMRTTNAEYNMLAIAKKLSENLKNKGFECIQDTTPHDYGTYTSAYAKSRTTVTNALNNINGAGIIIDVHRDASSNLDFRPVVNIKGIQVAQLMFVVGVGSNNNPNDKWKDNLKLALKLQQIADKVYPGLFRPMIVRNSIYNQDLNKYSLLIEFGATGNTIEEVKLSTRCMTNLLNIMYKD